MRGRKPSLKNVVPMRQDGVIDAELRHAAIERAVRELQPKGLNKEERAEWRRVARLLAEPFLGSNVGRGSFLAKKNNAGGNRAKGRKPGRRKN